MQQSPAARIAHLFHNVLAALVVLLMLCIVVQVAANAAGLSTLLRFESALPLLGRTLTINSLMEIQWHLLTLIGLLPVALIWAMDRHVRVDFIFGSLPARGRHGIELVGHVLFTLPFLWFAVPAGWAFTERALATAERSRDGGLTDRWMIKGVIPVALGLIFLVVVIDVLRQTRSLIRER